MVIDIKFYATNVLWKLDLAEKSINELLTSKTRFYTTVYIGFCDNGLGANLDLATSGAVTDLRQYINSNLKFPTLLG